ncbi:purple acid phosphatase family protein [Clostridium sp.]
MKKKYLSILLATFMTISLLTTSTFKVFANTYDNTTINSNLGATSKPDHLSLTWSSDPTTTMTITWRTNISVTMGQVQYMPLSSPSFIPTNILNVIPKLFKTSETDTHSGSMNLFTTTLTGLKPGTKYLYRVGNEKDGWSEVHSLTTETTEAKSTNAFKFLVFGDSQSGNAAVPDYNQWHDTVQNAFAKNSDAKFFINMGDLVEKGQDYVHWNNWFSASKGVIDTIPDMVVQGNHETYNANDWNSTKPIYYTNQFNVYNNGPVGLKGQVYSYNYGGCHFVVLDSQGEEESENSTGKIDVTKEKAMFDSEATWLKQDLAANKDSKFTMVFFHKTPYYNKASRANVLLKEELTPIFDKYHVDVVFNGHDHGISRTYPMYNDEMMQSPTEGTVYYVTGRSGAKYYSDLTSKVWDAKFYDPQDEPNYITVELKGSQLTINANKQDGTLIDSYVIDKSNPKNNTSNQELLPATYNVGNNQAIGDDPRLVIYGTSVTLGSSKAAIIDGRAYADINTIAFSMGGLYNAASKTLSFAATTKYVLTGAMLSKDGKLVSIDALNTFGFSNHYDKKFNMVFIEK